MKDARSPQLHSTDPPPSDRAPRPGRALVAWPILVAGLFAVSWAVLSWPFWYVIALQGTSPQAFFVFGRQFLQGFLSQPGGLLQYAGRFLGQFDEVPWLGAMVTAGCIAGFAALLGAVVARLRGSVSAWQVLLPGLLLLVLHTSPTRPLYQVLGLIACCTVFLGYLWMPGRVARYAYALILTPLAYLALGGYAWLLVAWIMPTGDGGGARRSDLAGKALYVVYSLAVPLAAYRWHFLTTLREALIAPLDLAPLAAWGSVASLAEGLLTVAFAVVLFAVPFGHRLVRRQSATGLSPSRRRALQIELAALLVLALVFRYDGRLSTYATCWQLYQHKQWDALLDKSRAATSTDLLLQFMTNSALGHKGKLLEEMFRFPQPFGPRGLVFNFVRGAVPDPTQDDTERAMFNSDLYYDMGHVNAAFAHADNYLVAAGETYAGYERMAQCSLVNANYDLARKYLTILSRTTFHQGFARRNLAIMADPKAAAREFAEARSRLPRLELPMYTSAIAPAAMLVPNRPPNRLAFDYVTAWLLLGRRLDELCADMAVYKTFGYATLPTHCQEALLLQMRTHPEATVPAGLRFDGEVMSLVDRFLRDVSQYEGRADAVPQLQRSYGNTYLFYYFFVAMPAQQQMQTNDGGGGGTARHE